MCTSFLVSYDPSGSLIADFERPRITSEGSKTELDESEPKPEGFETKIDESKAKFSQFDIVQVNKFFGFSRIDSIQNGCNFFVELESTFDILKSFVPGWNLLRFSTCPFSF